MRLSVPSQMGPFLVPCHRNTLAVCSFSCCQLLEDVSLLAVFIVSCLGHQELTFILWNKQYTLGRGKGGTSKHRRVKMPWSERPGDGPGPRGRCLSRGYAVPEQDWASCLQNRGSGNRLKRSPFFSPK